MNNQLNQISLALSEIRNAALAITDDPEPVWQKYDMIIAGEKFNKIYSLELCHCLSKCFNLEISIDQLNSVLPGVCDTLGMKYEAMIYVSDIEKTNPPIAQYSITLF